MTTVTRSDKLQTEPFSIDDMERFAREGFGDLGVMVCRNWRELNARFFEDVLRPVPIVLTHAQPYGRRLAFCSFSDDFGRTITLNVPKKGGKLHADNATLLHEMIHQHLPGQGEDPAHQSSGWRREIMRLHLAITRQELWAGEYKLIRDRKRDGGDGRLKRGNVPHPVTGRPSITQAEIARWPHDSKLYLGYLRSPVSITYVTRS